MAQETTQKKNRFFLLIIILLLAVVALLLLLLLRPNSAENQTPAMRNANATLGQYEGKTDEEIQAELNRIVEEGMFNISINPEITLENGESDAELRIENVPGNRYLMSVEITLDDTGEVLYRSGLIEPNYHIQSAPLDKKLAAGTYNATAVFTAHDPDTEADAGTAGAKIIITVEN
ncbi:MAG: hypothetical protein PHY23_00480 [Oscillospiraceae bacterium]|nr:hypothetical protein [Oscillospiraceae bacterium]